MRLSSADVCRLLLTRHAVSPLVLACLADTAGPFYDGSSEDIVLDKSDCRLVQVIHTSAAAPAAEGTLDIAYSIVALRLGSWKKAGHCDFWINCGLDQGPCIDVDVTDLARSMSRLAVLSDGEMANYVSKRICSHWRAPEIYNSGLRATCDHLGRPILANPCPTCGSLGHKCVDDPLPPANNTIPPFNTCSPEMDINYFVSSDVYVPHCPVRKRRPWDSVSSRASTADLEEHMVSAPERVERVIPPAPPVPAAPAETALPVSPPLATPPSS